MPVPQARASAPSCGPAATPWLRDGLIAGQPLSGAGLRGAAASLCAWRARGPIRSGQRSHRPPCRPHTSVELHSPVHADRQRAGESGEETRLGAKGSLSDKAVRELCPLQPAEVMIGQPARHGGWRAAYLLGACSSRHLSGFVSLNLSHNVRATFRNWLLVFLWLAEIIHVYIYIRMEDCFESRK